MKKILYLHIGCGKTGSSAIQVWLANNAKKLAKLGVIYPLTHTGQLEKYAITSGNGVPLYNAAKSGAVGSYLEPQLAGNNNVLFSTEAFQDLDENEIAEIQTAAKNNEYSIQIIAYVRDVYDMAYSSYLQLIKRNGYARTFKEFALSNKTLQQFEVIFKFQKIFDNISVFHYDSEKEIGLEKSFSDAMGIHSLKIPPMEHTKVNRSLTIMESELMRYANGKYTEMTGESSSEFSRLVSDSIIYRQPEKETQILLDQDALNYLNEKMAPLVEEINRKYFSDSRLKTFSKTGKNIVSKIPPIPSEFETLIGIMIQLSGKSRVKPEDAFKVITTSPAAEDAKIKNQTVQYLLKSALAMESSEIENAHALVRAAVTLRPNGPILIKKLNEYKLILEKNGVEKASESS